MTSTILCVDDDANILEGLKRQLRKEFEIETALGPDRGLECLEQRGPFAVVVSDLQMPSMNGIQFLTRVRNFDRDAVRVLLTGNADLQAAIEAINQGQIFRFLTKPCAPESLSATLQAALVQYRLVTGERELLEQTLGGSIRVLCEILSLVNPEAFGRSARVTRYVEAIAQRLLVSELWSVKTAAMLSQIGCVILPETVLKKVYRGEALAAEESQLYNQHPFVAADLLAQIPRMKPVADIIRCQDKCIDGFGVPGDSRQGNDIPLEVRILKVALDFDALEASGKSKTEAYEYLRKRKDWYDPGVIEALKHAFAAEIRFEVQTSVVAELKSGMVLDEDIISRSNVLLVSRGQEVNGTVIRRLENFVKTVGVREPFRVLAPLDQSGD